MGKGATFRFIAAQGHNFQVQHPADVHIIIREEGPGALGRDLIGGRGDFINP
jgi:hypothetical protein